MGVGVLACQEFQPFAYAESFLAGTHTMKGEEVGALTACSLSPKQAEPRVPMLFAKTWLESVS